MIKLRQRDVLLLMEHAKKNLIELPNDAKLEYAPRPLTVGERLAVSYFQAALTLLGGMGVKTDNVVISLDDSHHDPV
jgi:hypothetical protein